MSQPAYRVYPYRWVVLLTYMGITALNQLLWISFAPITSGAAAYMGVSDLAIGLLSVSFMIVYLVVSIPASWAIDTWGMRAAVGIGAALTGGFGLMRGLVAPNYTLVLVAQRFMPSFYAVFRNSGFVIVTLIMRLSLSAPSPWNAAASLFAAAYMLALTWAMGYFAPERFREKTRN